MSTIFNEIIRHKARKLAKAHIKWALDDLKCGGQFNFEGKLHRQQYKVGKA